MNENKKMELIKSEQRLLEVENKIIANKINKITTDLLYVSDCFSMYDKGDGDYSEAAKLWLAFSDRKKSYDQIRFLDIDGNEVLRVNYINNEAVLTAKDELQNKKGRYYFEDTIKLGKNRMYISVLDLNVENNVVEEPIKPMLRVSKPYYDAEGVLKGIIIMNYSANDMLKQVKEVATSSNGDIYLLNTEGYWIYDSKNSDNEWSFMYKERMNNSFKNEYASEWKEIQKNKSGYTISDKGMFIYSSIITNKLFEIDNLGYSIVLGSGDWTMVSFLSSDTENGKICTEGIIHFIPIILADNFIWYIFIFILAVVIATLISINNNEKERIKYYSEYDTMTGVFNRRAGFERLKQLYKDMSKKEEHISVCFIDINGLKEVNDSLGHESGDELILSVINGIKKNIRNNDFVARLGGDEFLIIFEGLDETKTQEIWERIIDDYNNINKTEDRKYIISVSHGIETFKCGTIDYIDSIVNHADEKMYLEKRQIKKDLKILK
jgi:diguanylate cyclase (GGDEF)-like protein